MKKLHYFLVSYTAVHSRNSKLTGYFWLSGDNRNIGQKTIDFINNHIIKMTSDEKAIPIINSISYLGFMTEKEFNDDK